MGKHLPEEGAGEFYSATDIINRANKLVDLWLEANKKIEGEVNLKHARSVVELKPEPRSFKDNLSEDLAAYFDDELAKLNAGLLTIVPGMEKGSSKNLKALQARAIGGGVVEKEKLKLLDRIIENGVLHPIKTLKNVKEVLLHKAPLEMSLRAAAREVEEKVNEKELKKLEERFSDFDYLVEVGRILVNAKRTANKTQLQESHIMDCEKALQLYSKGKDDPSDVNRKRLLVDLNDKFNRLEQMMDAPKAIREARKRFEDLRAKVEMKMVSLRSEVAGRRKVFDTLSEEIRGDYKMLGRLLGAIEIDLKKAEAVAAGIIKSIDASLEELKAGEKDYAKIEDLVVMAGKEDLEQAYLSNFTEISKDLASFVGSFDFTLRDSS